MSPTTRFSSAWLAFLLLSAAFSQVLAQPTANRDVLGMRQGSQIIFNPLTNDAGAVSSALLSSPLNGTILPLAGGNYRYRPSPGFRGLDSLQYQACDAASVCDQATVLFRVFPTGLDIRIRKSGFVDLPIGLYPEDFEEDEFDDFESVLSPVPPLNGTLVPDLSDQIIRYEPDPGFSGADSFVVLLCEGPECFGALLRVSFVDTCNNELCVLPGDTNRDGVVDQDDLIGIGWSFGLSGFAREGASGAFFPQPGSDWRTDFGGSNSKYGDCDGDGLVSPADTIPLLANYRETLPRRLYTPTAINTTPVPSSLNATYDPDVTGDTVYITINLGTPANPGVNLYGFSASLSFDFPLTANSKKAIFDFSNSWIAPPSDQPLTLGIIDTVSRRLDFALTRTDRAGVTGSGNLVVIKLITEDNIGERPGIHATGLGISLDLGTLHLADRSRERMEPVQVLQQVAVPGSQPQPARVETLVYPNPVSPSGCWNVEHSPGINRLVLRDAMGRVLRTQQGGGSTALCFPAQDLAPGWYLLELEDASGARHVLRAAVR
jgi:hypothetical protein